MKIICLVSSETEKKEIQLMSNVAELGWRDDEADHVIRDPEGCHCSQSPDWSSQELLIIRNDKSYEREWETFSILTWWSTAHKAGPPAVGGDVRGVVPALVCPGLRSFGWIIHFLKLNLTLVKFILKPGRSLYGSLLWIKNKWDVTVRDTKSLPASSPVSLQRWVASFHNKFYKNQFSLELEIFH